MTFDHILPPSLWREHDKAHQAFYAELTQQRKPTRPRKRKPTLAGVARQKAGIPVARYDFRPDGTISLVTGKPVGDIDKDDTASLDPKWN